MKISSNYSQPSPPSSSTGATEEANEAIKDRQQWSCHFDGCKAILYSKSSRFRHQKLHENPSSQYQCNECPSSFLMKLDLMDHERRTHMSPSSYVVCNHCERTFSSVSNLNAHKEIHLRSAVSKHVCDICNVSYFQSSALRRHWRNDHGETSDWSGSSSMQSSSPPLYIKENKSYYNAIDRSQTITPPSQTCLICNGIFPSDYEFHRHLGAIHYLSSTFACIINHCKVQIRKRTDFENHQKVHPYFHNK
jgi:Zinc finger, C2H2 type